MINDRQLADAILARKPESVRRMEIAHDDCPLLGVRWNVTLHDGSICASECDPLLLSALAKANGSLFRQREQIARQGSVALAYACDWTATALQCEREGVN